MKKILGLCFAVGLFGCSSGDKSEAKDTIVDPEIHAAYKEQMRKKQEAYPKVNISQNMDVVDMATCTAAAMKAGQGIELFTQWSDALTLRYMKVYPDKNSQEIDGYTTERISDKRKYLQSIGITTAAGFYKFYKQNCES